jgi:hypothetical protein
MAAMTEDEALRQIAEEVATRGSGVEAEDVELFQQLLEARHPDVAARWCERLKKFAAGTGPLREAWISLREQHSPDYIPSVAEAMRLLIAVKQQQRLAGAPKRKDLRAPKWLYAVDNGGIAVAEDFGKRVLAGDKVAVRQLLKLDVTTLYARYWSRDSAGIHFIGLFWDNAKPHIYFPLIRGNSGRRALGKPNPALRLVVVNAYDKKALRQLLAQAPSDNNVQVWMAARTRAGGPTQQARLYADYVVWCEAQSELAVGTKAFSQAIADHRAGRRGGGVHYQLKLRK